jgi:exosortase/archaeosortase family protein
MSALRLSLSHAAFALGAAILAIGPILWLVETWRDPAFASNGAIFFAVVAALFVWSVTSGRLDGGGKGERLAICLLAITALVRLAGQVLAIDTIGALALAIDVYAFGRLLQLDRRNRSISPLWLAAAFAFCLPLERIAQRCVGYALQEVSARGACGVLSATFDRVTCEGVRIGVNGADVMVDLPCSGSQALVVFGFIFALLATLTRPRAAMSVLGVGIALAAAVAGNIVRIALLAAGVAAGPARLGFNVMEEPWHGVVGLVTLGLSALPLMLWASAVRPAPLAHLVSIGSSVRIFGIRSAATFCAIAVVVVAAPHRPIDIGARTVSIAAPERIGGYRAALSPLTATEQTYFQQYGGAAVKARYGPYALLLTRTTAPLRHLHAPDECLRGLGYRVEYVGLRFTPAPSARYRAIAPDGRAYDIETSFVADNGRVAASVSEAVWIWLSDRSTVWTSIQRIAPAGSDAQAQAAFDAGVIAALDLRSTRQTFAQRE